MSTRKVLAPEVQLRGQRGTEQEPSDQAETARSRESVDHSCPNVHISRRSSLFPALALALVIFAVCYLAGHVAAAIFGWYGCVYIGVGVGVWLILSAFVAMFIAGAAGHDR